MIVPFNRAAFGHGELRHLVESLSSLYISSDGPFTKRCAELLSAELGASRTLLTTSCTDALELSALLLRLEPGDEVIMPSFTFVSTANAYALRGARPVFVDLRPDTWNLDERLVERAITQRTKAIVVVHYGGVACEMDTLVELANRHGVALIEDNAHGLFGRYRGRPLGSFGSMSALSFHETKNLSCGEGGALCVNDEALVERAEILHAKGTNRARYLRGQIDKYSWVDVGSSFGLSDLLASVLWGQLGRRDEILAKRRAIFERYAEAFEPLVREGLITLQVVPEKCESSFHMFAMLTATQERRDALLAFLRERDVYGAFHYVPLHSSPQGVALGCAESALPITDAVSARLLRLPFFTAMTEAEQTRVIECVLAFASEKLAGPSGDAH